MPNDLKGRAYNSILRILLATAIAVPACAVIVGVLFLLPSSFALGALFVGLAMFMAGAELEMRWTAVIGGVLMFGGLLAAVLLGALK